MKNLIALLLIFTITAANTSAQVCTDKTDPFTGKISKVGFAYLGSSILQALPMFGFSKVDTTRSVGFMMTAPVGVDAFDKEKMFLLVRFKDGVVKKFMPSPTTVIASSPGFGVTVAYYSDVSLSQLDIFKTNPVVALRFSYKGDENFGFDIEVNNSKAKKIIKALDCVL